MTDSDSGANKAWVENWLRTQPRLEQIRRGELRAFNYRQRLPMIDALLEIGCRFGSPRVSSGLVEQQRLFAKAKHLFTTIAK